MVILIVLTVELVEIVPLYCKHRLKREKREQRGRGREILIFIEELPCSAAVNSSLNFN
jgi:hypothetical protein